MLTLVERLSAELVGGHLLHNVGAVGVTAQKLVDATDTVGGGDDIVVILEGRTAGLLLGLA